MSDLIPENHDAQPAVSEEAAIDTSRRKLAGTALGVAAVFTLASRPVLAGGTCVAPSAAASGNLSVHGTAPNCGGCKDANYWKVTQHPYKTKKYHDAACFPNKRSGRVDWKNKTVGDVLNNNNSGNFPDEANPVCREFATTLLNIRSGYLPAQVLDEMKLQQMWNEWVNTGKFSPTAGASWDANQIVTYLQGLHN